MTQSILIGWFISHEMKRAVGMRRRQGYGLPVLVRISHQRLILIYLASILALGSPTPSQAQTRCDLDPKVLAGYNARGSAYYADSKRPTRATKLAIINAETNIAKAFFNCATRWSGKNAVREGVNKLNAGIFEFEAAKLKHSLRLDPQNELQAAASDIEQGLAKLPSAEAYARNYGKELLTEIKHYQTKIRRPSHAQD